MKKLLPCYIYIFVTFGISLLFSCTSNIELPPSPDSLFSSGDSSSSTDSNSGGSDSSSSIGGGSNVSSSSQTLPPPSLDADEFLDTRDNQKYKFEIASNGRVWMSENLRYSNNGTIGYCYKDGSSKYPGTRAAIGEPGENLPGCDSPYGRNYTYEVATGGQTTLDKAKGICPTNWHIPNATEWGTRTTEIPNARAGNYNTVSSSDPMQWQSRIGGTGGGCNSAGCGFYWHSNATKSNGLGFVFVMSNVEVRPTSTETGLANSADLFSVRCIMNEGGKLSCGSSLYDPATESCTNGKIYEKCGTKIYNPDLYLCEAGSLTCSPTITSTPNSSGYYCSGNYVYSGEGEQKLIYIGDKVWMTERLISGASMSWASAMVLPDDCNSTNCATSIQTPHHQGKCPTGWHIPKRDEITTDAFFNNTYTWWTATQEVGNEIGYAYYKLSGGGTNWSSKTNGKSVLCVKDY